MSNQGASGQGSQNRPDDNDGEDTEDMAPEYDFSQGVRGKHAMAMREGYRMVIHHNDGTTEVRDVTPRPGTVVLDPDVRAYFPDSEAVNRALRSLIGQGSQPSTPSDTTQ
jgi:hypothetical protein